MSKERFQRTGMNSFYGEFFCDAVVPKDDFLRMLVGPGGALAALHLQAAEVLQRQSTYGATTL